MSGRPTNLAPWAIEVYDWLATNGVDEAVPAEPNIVVHADTLIYTSWVWRDGKRGWDMWNIVVGHGGFPHRQRRRVPLLAPPTERIRAVCRAVRIHLTEIVPVASVKAGAVP